MYTTYWSVMASACCFFQTRNIAEWMDAMDDTPRRDTTEARVIALHDGAPTAQGARP